MRRIMFLLLALGLSASALGIDQPASTAPDLRNAYASLNAVLGVPDGFKVDFDDAEVLLRSITAEPTSGPDSGGCRVLVSGRAKFACVDGPAFDAHQVDFDVLAQRNAMYRAAERDSLQRFEQNPERDLNRVEHVCRLAERHPELIAYPETEE